VLSHHFDGSNVLLSERTTTWSGSKSSRDYRDKFWGKIDSLAKLCYPMPLFCTVSKNLWFSKLGISSSLNESMSVCSISKAAYISYIIPFRLDCTVIWKPFSFYCHWTEIFQKVLLKTHLISTLFPNCLCPSRVPKIVVLFGNYAPSLVSFYR
jgi:hypothetical protein